MVAALHAELVQAPSSPAFRATARRTWGCAQFVRTIRLPFVPAAGMAVVPQDGPDEGEGEPIQSVRWLCKEQRFVCHTGDDFEGDDTRWESLVRHYQRQGYGLQDEGVWVEEETCPLRAVSPEDAGEGGSSR
jgi:hypothetical protein